ncbi:DNA sulfur modification protein DndB [Paenibacillus tianjinensis]|uniref:DNA-sulfur modification-associated n=1 Tax=Paenibacillus tianjinensis TaxID=2810347 RepID=A0ABX7LBV4_9BACL|nr:DNA sulfur modification protein DndB [Paenibacillus tianjinensis]QSF43472.1 hypothetical protein JRJ22_19605 [Paenibacillus tianjinensis]
MKKDRERLELLIADSITEIKVDRKKVLKVNNLLSELGVPFGTFDEISKGDKQLSTVDSSLLCALSETLYEVSGNTNLKSDQWFTNKEISYAKKELSNNNETNRIILPIALENVEIVNIDNYITKIKMVDLVQWFHSQLIIYDFETQRSAKFKTGKNGVVPVPDINLKSVKDIADNMLNGTYLEDMITLNIYSDETEAVEYNPKTRILTINEQAAISILDGFHRLQGGVRACATNPELEQMMILSIRSYDTDTAKKYFGQINTINVVKKERLKELKSQEFSDLVVRDLQQKTDLKGRIASASKISELAGQLTTFDILSFAIDKVFKPKSRLDAREASETLIKFFDYLIGSFVDEFMLNPNKYRDDLINHSLMFVGYVVIAKYFEDNNMPIKNIKDFIDKKINFKDKNLIELLNSKRGINNAKVRNEVINYFEMLLGVNENVQ